MANNQPTLPSSIAGQPSINYRESDLDSPKKAIFLHKVQDTDSSEEIHAIQKINRIAVPTKDVALTESSSKKQNTYLYGILALNLLMCFGMNYVFDFPQALEDPLIRKLDVDPSDIGYLYAMYALPNILLSPVSGYLIEKYNPAYSGLAFTMLNYIGQLLCLAAVSHGKFYLAIIGRGLYGIGGEGTLILQATINEYWFSGKFLSVSNGLCQTFNNMADMMGNFLTPLFFEKHRNIQLPLFIGACVCALSCFVGIWYFILHTAYQQRHVDNEDEEESSKELKREFALMKAQDPDFKFEFGFSSIKYFNLTFWLLCGVYLFLANAMVQFTNMATDLIMNRYSYAYEHTKYFTVLPQASFVFLSPIMSKVIETKGRKALFLLIASVVCYLNYLMMYYLDVAETNWLYFNMCVIGFSNSILLSSIFSSVGLTVPKQGVSMAYSILALVENLGIGILPIYFGWLSKDRSVDSYNRCLVGFQVLSICAIVFSFALLVHDIRQNHLLELPENSSEVKKIRTVINKDYLRRSFNDSHRNSRPGSRPGSQRDILIPGVGPHLTVPKVGSKPGSGPASKPGSKGGSFKDDLVKSNNPLLEDDKFALGDD